MGDALARPHETHVVSSVPWPSAHRARALSSIADALDALSAEAPALIFTDLDLHDGSGLELLAAADDRQRQRGLRRTTVIVVTDEKVRAPERLALRPNYWLRSHPLDLDMETRAVLARGAVPSPELFDYCVLATMGSRAVTLEVGYPGSPSLGHVHIRNNHVWTAADAFGNDRGALLRLAQATGARISCRPLSDSVHVRPSSWSIERVVREALTDVLDYEDERPSAVPTQPPSSSSSLDGPPSVGRLGVPRGPHVTTRIGLQAVVVEAERRAPSNVRTFAELWEDAVDLMLHKQYAQAVAVLRKAKSLRPDDPSVAANLRRLEALGFS